MIVQRRETRVTVSLPWFSISTDETRAHVNSALFEIGDGKIRMVSTDGHRLAYASAMLDENVPSKQEVILPRKTVIELQRLLSDAEGAIEMQFANNQAKFSFDGMEFVTKLVEGKFPDYNRVIPKGHSNNLTLAAKPSCLACSAPPS